MWKANEHGHDVTKTFSEADIHDLEGVVIESPKM